jgi:hypothetical protein
MHVGLRVFATAALVLGIAAAPAHASAPYAIWNTDGNGDPSLVAADSGAIVTLSECVDGGSTCTPVADQSAADGYANATPGETPAGAVFKATFAYAGQPAVTWSSPIWKGRLSVTSPPTLTLTAPIVGGNAVPQAGSATGGWDGSLISVTGVQACTLPTGGNCWTITYSGSSGPIDFRWVGYYFAALGSWGSISVLGNPPMPAMGALGPLPWGPYPWAQPAPILPPVQSRSTFVGPIAAAEPASEVSTSPVTRPAPPTASIRARALRGKGQLSVARVTCATKCTVELTVSGGGKTIRRTLSVTGARALTIAPRHGKLKVKVVVDGKTLASGVSRAR